MKTTWRFSAVIFALLIVFSTSLPVYAMSNSESRSTESFFIEANLLKGDGGSYGLEKTPTRLEGTIILIRLLGKEDEAQKMKSLPCRFTDVPSWAVGYANYSYDQNISKGVSDAVFGVNDPISAKQFNTLLLRTIGYNDSTGDFQWNESVSKANSLGILPADLANQYESSTKFSKKDLLETSFCYLDAKYKGASSTLIGTLTESGVISKDLANEYGFEIGEWDSITTNATYDEYTTFEIEGDTLRIKGLSIDDNKNWILAVLNNKDTDKEFSQRVSMVDKDGDYDFTIPITGIPKGEYYVNLYANYEQYNYYTSFVWSSIILKETGESTYFEQSPAYAQNLKSYKSNEVEEQDKVMTLETRSDPANSKTIENFAKDITKGLSGDYKKLQAIHDWITENIYYDVDYATDKTESTNIDSISVLENKYAVCSGYSNLAKDLITAAGIPCKQVVGFALGVSEEDDWDDVDFSTISPNHVWNEAYVDGRWVIIDATWDSDNKYEDGKLVEGHRPSRLYFDASIEFLSNTHLSTSDEL